MGLLDGRIAVITGGTRGFGYAVAQAYTHEGAKVVLASRSEEAVQRAVGNLTGAGAGATGIPCDVGDFEQVQALSEHAINSFGRYDIWVNNAGLSAPYGPTADIPVDEFEKVIRTNIFGVYYGSLIALRFYLQNSHTGSPFPGKLINILGEGATRPVPMQIAYAASKSWIRNFTLALAKEDKNKDVGIFAFNPGLMETDLLRKVDVISGYQGRLAPLKTVMRMWGKLPDIPAQKAVWLASAETDGRTGLEIKELRFFHILNGALREGFRRLLRRPAPDWEIEVNVIAPECALPADGEYREEHA
ncbi:MAG: SDR family NAD(P)-dependent oxidoreductase [Anaerolineales bacterium]|jgi:glucose 1-dehydrogenase